MGVNLFDGTFHHSHEPTVLIGKLMDGLYRRGIEVDMVPFSGPDPRPKICFVAKVSNRMISVRSWTRRAA